MFDQLTTGDWITVIGIGITIFGAIVTLIFLAGGTYRDVRAMREDVSKIPQILTRVEVLWGERSNKLVESKSPLVLNKVGIEISESIKAKNIINKNWEDIKNRIEDIIDEDYNPYEIQQASFEIGQKYSSLASESEMDEIKLYAYEHGRNLDEFDAIFGIEIRNRFLDENKINVSDIDLHDPNKKGKTKQ